MEKVIFKSDNENLELKILEQTTLAGVNYILATNDEEEAYILKNVSEDDEDVIYEFVNDDELQIVSKIFSELLDIELQ